MADAKKCDRCGKYYHLYMQTFRVWMLTSFTETLH